MATTHRQQTPDLILALRANPGRFDFFQAVRLLRARPHLGLGFPAHDIAALEPAKDGGWRMTVTFGGLYGVASALPAYDTEDLLDEQCGDVHAARDFLDILHHVIYLQLFEAWSKPRLARKVVEDRDATALARLHALLGLGDAPARARAFSFAPQARLLRHAAALARRSRGATGLEGLLADLFPHARIDLDGRALHRASIPLDQRWRLGSMRHALGHDSTLGARIDETDALHIRLDALTPRHYHQLLPGHAAHKHLRALLAAYFDRPMHTTLQLHCRRVQPARCGGTRWCALGHDSWLLRFPCHGPSDARFVILA